VRPAVRQEVVLVTGSRDWADATVIRECLKAHPRGTILIHGGCRGADQIAAIEGRGLGYVLWELPYFEDDSGKEARNASMVSVASALRERGHRVTCYAWPLGASYGTRKCMRQMRFAALRIANFGDVGG
jgi:hypothetical protein